MACDGHDQVVTSRASLDVVVQVGEVDGVVAKGLDLLLDLLEADMFLSAVGELTVVAVEVNQAHSLFTRHLHGSVVLTDEVVGKFGWVHPDKS